MVLVKIQLPVDLKRMQETGKAYADPDDHDLLIYDKKRKHFWQGRDDELRKVMLDAAHGRGYMKAFMLADWDKDHWAINYELGFQPLALW